MEESRPNYGETFHILWNPLHGTVSIGDAVLLHLSKEGLVIDLEGL